MSSFVNLSNILWKNFNFKQTTLNFKVKCFQQTFPPSNLQERSPNKHLNTLSETSSATTTKPFHCSELWSSLNHSFFSCSIGKAKLVKLVGCLRVKATKILVVSNQKPNRLLHSRNEKVPWTIFISTFFLVSCGQGCINWLIRKN